jgi:IS30 family transposase
MDLSQTKIANYLGVIRSTISRELKRNLPKRSNTAGCFIGEHAQRKTDHRLVSRLKSSGLTEDMKRRIKGLMIHEKWSPELLAKRLTNDSEQCVSHKTIYKWIWMA